MPAMATFVARHVAHTGTFGLPLPVEEALPLFTAEGERRWVPGWEPVYLFPAIPSNEAGTVFRTGHGGDDTIWIVLKYDPASGTAEYARVTPATRAGTVEVRCVPTGAHSTRVQVSYSLTALTPAGNTTLESLSRQAYTAMLAEWQALIHSALGLGPVDAVS
jgi:hypothetical protein